MRSHNQSERAVLIEAGPQTWTGKLLEFLSALFPLIARWRKRTARRYAQMAQTARQNGHLVTAKSYFDAALKWQPTDPWILGELGQLHYEREEYDDAISLYKKALNIDPSNQSFRDGGIWFGGVVNLSA